MLPLTEKEHTFLIAGPVGQIEVKWLRPDATGIFANKSWCAIVCHPNPTRGGDMNNKVVTTLLRTYRDLGIPVFTFNFRGVGNSSGEFDRGIGEREDLRAVVAWCRSQLNPAGLLLAGFSFGSSIAAAVGHQCEDLLHLLLVAPPVDRYDYEINHRFAVPVAVVQGGQDELIPAQQVYDWAARLQSPLRLVAYEKAGHFFHGFLTALKRDVSDVLAERLA